jgi:hypothetical protein
LDEGESIELGRSGPYIVARFRSCVLRTGQRGSCSLPRCQRKRYRTEKTVCPTNGRASEASRMIVVKATLGLQTTRTNHVGHFGQVFTYCYQTRPLCHGHSGWVGSTCNPKINVDNKVIGKLLLNKYLSNFAICTGSIDAAT